MIFFECKKLIATAFTFVMVIALAGLPLPARERRGAMVEVTLADGSRIKGELLAVKSDALLVFDRTADQGKSLDLQQVAQVKVLKKPKFGQGLLFGLGVGLVIGCNPEKNVHIKNYWLTTLIGFGLIGVIGEAFAAIPEKISLDGNVFRIRQVKLERLKRYAREQD